MEDKLKEVIEVYKEENNKECYVIDLVDETPSILDDKIGGIPYIPIGEEYPTDDKGNPLALLIQINLENIDLEGYPKSGILEIFTDNEVDYPCKYSIKYYESGLDYREDIPSIDLKYYIVNRGYKIKYYKDTCYMSASDYRFDDAICSAANKVLGTDVTDSNELDNIFDGIDWYYEVLKAVKLEKVILGGYPDFTQTDPRGYSIKDKDECLFKLDVYGDYDKYTIGDSGILFVLISKEDIENKQFENAIVDWDCY